MMACNYSMTDGADTFGISSNCSNVTFESINNSSKWEAPDFDTSAKHILLAIVLGIIVIVTIFGNLLVIISFVVERKLLQPFNLYIMNLAVTDFLVAVTAMAFYTFETVLGYWPFGIYMCAIWIFFDYGMTFASVFTLVAISVDRLWCVTWPVHFKNYNNKRKTAIIILLIWSCVIAIWTPPFLGDRLKHSEAHLCIWDPSKNTEFAVFVAVVGHHLPCKIIIICYIKVLLMMRRQIHITGFKNTNTTIRKIKVHGPSFSNTRIETQTTDDYLHDSHIENTSLSATGQIKDIVSGQTDSVFTVRWKGDEIQASVPKTESRYRCKRSPTQRREKRIFVTLTYIMFSYMVCWFPFYIAFDVSFSQPELVPAWLYSLFFWSTYVNSTLNPFIYAYTNKEFRAAFIKVCMCVKRCK